MEASQKSCGAEHGRNQWSGSAARSGISQSGNGAESGMSRPLTARSNPWLEDIGCEDIRGNALHCLSMLPTRD